MNELKPSPVRGFDTDFEIEKQAEFIKSLAPKTAVGVTLNFDGSHYQGGGIAVPLKRRDFDLRSLGLCESYSYARHSVNELKGQGIDTDPMKVGLLKVKGRVKMSLDLEIVLPQESREVAIDYARWAGLGHLWDLDNKQCIATDTVYRHPRSIPPEQYADIIKPLQKGKLPECVDLTEH